MPDAVRSGRLRTRGALPRPAAPRPSGGARPRCTALERVERRADLRDALGLRDAPDRVPSLVRSSCRHQRRAGRRRVHERAQLGVRAVREQHGARLRVQRIDVAHAVVLFVGPRELVTADPVRRVGRDGRGQRDAGLHAALHLDPIDVVAGLGVAHEHARCRRAARDSRRRARTLRRSRATCRAAGRSRAARCAGTTRVCPRRARAPRPCSRRRTAARSRRPRARAGAAARGRGERGASSRDYRLAASARPARRIEVRAAASPRSIASITTTSARTPRSRDGRGRLPRRARPRD